MRSGSTLTSTADAVWLPARDVPSKPPTLKQKARPAIELLTTAEAAWQVRVLILAATAYVFIIILVRYSPGVLLLTVLFLAAMVAALMFSVDRQTNRANALENLRSAFASGDAGRIRAAIWHARAAGVSAEEVASTKELRAAVSGKLRQALADQDVERLSTAVRCAQAAAISPEDAGEPLTAALSILNNAVPRTRPDIERSSSTSSSTSCRSGSSASCGTSSSIASCGTSSSTVCASSSASCSTSSSTFCGVASSSASSRTNWSTISISSASNSINGHACSSTGGSSSRGHVWGSTVRRSCQCNPDACSSQHLPGAKPQPRGHPRKRNVFSKRSPTCSGCWECSGFRRECYATATECECHLSNPEICGTAFGYKHVSQPKLCISGAVASACDCGFSQRKGCGAVSDCECTISCPRLNRTADCKRILS
mmetsp:Transcript_156746/g.300636  ORF Transcript_156746/g.300636 Transcript_156746/m.300636 type:complete len:427 (-) Transcript_156746:5326-6606(-)